MAGLSFMPVELTEITIYHPFQMVKISVIHFRRFKYFFHRFYSRLLKQAATHEKCHRPTRKRHYDLSIFTRTATTVLQSSLINVFF